jgi:heat shock protein HslJ
MMKRIKKMIYLLYVVVLLALTSCEPSENETPTIQETFPPGADSRLESTSWRLVSFGPLTSETQVIEGTNITLEFDGNVKAGGFSGCNTYNAEYVVSGGNRISIEEIIATEIACTAEGVMEQESAYYEALRSIERYENAGDRLTLWYNQGQSALNFTRLTGSTPVPATPSPGTFKEKNV